MESRQFARLLAILALVAVAGVTSSPVSKEAQKSPAQSYYDQFPVESRADYVRYFLDKALAEQGYLIHSPRILPVNVERYYGPAPEGFAATLLDIAKNTLEMEDQQVEDIVVFGKVCIPAKGCYDPNDVGGHCCPMTDIQQH